MNLSTAAQAWMADAIAITDFDEDTASSTQALWDQLLLLGMTDFSTEGSVRKFGGLRIPLSETRAQVVYFMFEGSVVIYSPFAELGEIKTQVAFDLSENSYGLFVIAEKYCVGTTLFFAMPTPFYSEWPKFVAAALGVAVFADHVEQQVSGMVDKY